MQTIKTSLVILICAALLAACGLKGPLYLPDESSAAKPAIEGEASPDADDEERQEETEEDIDRKSPIAV
jgi:predicted small lipoprotein YifL